MPFQLDYHHILPRQSVTPTPSQQTQTQTTIVGSTGVTPTGLDNGTTIINVLPTATDLGLSATATGDSASFFTSASPSSSASADSAPQTFPPRTLVAICVPAGILLGGIIILILWWDRSKKNAPEEPHGEESFSHGASTQDMKLRGLTGVHASPPPPIDSLRRPSSGITVTAYDHGYHSAAGKGGYDHDAKQSLDVAYLPSISSNYVQEDSFLSLSPAKADPLRPQTASPSTPPQSPRSASAQPITHPYSVGAHPFAHPSSHAQLYRPSFERTATSTTAIAQDPATRLGMGTHTAGFAGAGARPGYDAYGFESRTAGATSPNYNGTIVHRPSIESIRNLARKASQPNLPSEPTYPPAGGYTRTRNNSTSTYAGSVRAGKVKPTKEEKAKEMAAMDNLIAALDESAEAERRRKERLVAAAGITDNQQSSSSKKGTGTGTGSGRRKDAAITGSYPLPPPEVFRAALSRGVADDEPDDYEIERWRRN